MVGLDWNDHTRWCLPYGLQGGGQARCVNCSAMGCGQSQPVAAGSGSQKTAARPVYNSTGQRQATVSTQQKAASGVAAEKGNLGVPRRQSHPDEPLITGEAPQPQPRIVDVEDAPGELKKRAGLTDSQESFFKRLDSNVDSAVADGKPEMATFIEPT